MRRLAVIGIWMALGWPALGDPLHEGPREARVASDTECAKELAACSKSLSEATVYRKRFRYVCAGLCETKPSGWFVESKSYFLVGWAEEERDALTNLRLKCLAAAEANQHEARRVYLMGAGIGEHAELATPKGNCRRVSGDEDTPLPGATCPMQLRVCRSRASVFRKDAYQYVCASDCHTQKAGLSELVGEYKMVLTHSRRLEEAYERLEDACASEASFRNADYHWLRGHNPHVASTSLPVTVRNNCYRTDEEERREAGYRLIKGE